MKGTRKNLLNYLKIREMGEDKKIEQVEIKFTLEEVKLLQKILVHLKDEDDWSNDKNHTLMVSSVLNEHDKSLPSKINKIYNKLF